MCFVCVLQFSANIPANRWQVENKVEIYFYDSEFGKQSK